MYCQKCYSKLPEAVNVCPSCHYNNSSFLSQPNILFGQYKDRELPMVTIDLKDNEEGSSKGWFGRVKKAVSAAFKGD